MREAEYVGHVPDERERHQAHIWVGIDTHALFYMLLAVLALFGLFVGCCALRSRKRAARKHVDRKKTH